MPPTVAPSNNTTLPCEQCKLMKNVMIGMEPGADGKPWWLCFKCWLEGAKGKKQEQAS
jgi:hypothetical protein